ncbi:MAG: cyclomaltodextrinase C-terminal domain-containing protein, partial [Bacteroidales bacterium]|nr:cyclomaltodextrinase C-terminal domain-containing protein [Bacteroidales bacterium]
FERADRMNPSGVHGGDLQGITSAVDYIANLGITTIELTPLYESNQLVLSYEKFSPTNHYSVDPRLGNPEELRKLVTTYQEKGMKVILTQVLHKIGNQHILAQKPPFFDWIHERPSIQSPTPNPVVFADPNASQEDLNRHTKVWEAFDTPVLNHELETVRRYLIQNTIWWIETSGVDGIRIEKTHLNSPIILKELCEEIRKEYPKLNLISSPQTDMVVHNNYWKEGPGLNPQFTHVSDMPLNFKMIDAFAEYQKSNEALIGIYKIIASDLIYNDPSNQTIITGDAHDLTRLFTLADKDPVIFRIYMGFLLTVRGIPSFLYGSEIQMEGLGLEGSGFVRGDFPGGWNNDRVSALNQNTLSVQQRDGLHFVTTLLKYRKDNPAIMQGKTIQFEPRDDIYAYFRCSEKKKLLVIINNNQDSPRRLESNRFNSSVGKIQQVVNVISGEISSGLGNIILNPKSILILELTNVIE